MPSPTERKKKKLFEDLIKEKHRVVVSDSPNSFMSSLKVFKMKKSGEISLVFFCRLF